MQRPHDAQWLGQWDETLEWDGVWWVASDTTRFGGTFELESFELAVLGGKLAGMNNVPRIYGICSGINVTLVNCHHLRVDDRGMEVHGQTLSASLFIVGAHLGLESLKFSQAQWHHPNLEVWAQRFPFETPSPKFTDAEVQQAEREELVSREGKLFLEQWARVRGGHWTYSKSIEFGERLSLQLLDERPLHEIYWKWIVPVDRFLSLLMSRAGAYARLQVKRSGNASWCDVHYPIGSSAPRGDQLSSHQVPVPFNAVRTSSLLTEWLRLHDEIAAICGTVLSPVTRQLTPYARFMALASVAESLAYYLFPLSAEVKKDHKKRVKDIIDRVEADEKEWLQEKIGRPSRTFRSSLELLGNHPGLPRPWYCEEFFGWAWTGKFRDTRNFYAHGSEKQLEIDEVHLDLMARCLDALIRTHLLHKIGLTSDELRVAISSDPSIRDLLYTVVEQIDES